MDMTLKEATLGYLTVLGVSEFQDQLSPGEQDIGIRKMTGCLQAIEDRLYGQGDQTSLSLVDAIEERERINGRTPDLNDSGLIESTRNCAQMVFDYYVERCR